MSTTTTVQDVDLVDDAQAARPGVFTLTVHEPCGTILAPNATHCPVCTGQCGGPCCTGGTR